MNENLIWILLGLASAFFAALVAILGKVGISHLDSTVATTIRALIMFLFLFLVTVSSNKLVLAKHLDSRSFIFIILSAICGAISWLAYFLALKLGPATKVTALDRLSMVFVVLMAVFINEPLRWQTVIGSIILTMGAVITVLC
jgi:bacterial/archaeal transporter family protein